MAENVREDEAALPCVVCGRALENIDPEGNQPNDGVSFTTRGHYGTTVFDPMDGSFLEINVCDPCLRSAIEKGQVLEGMPVPPPRPVYYMKATARHTQQEGDRNE